MQHEIVSNETHIRIDEGMTRTRPESAQAWPTRKPPISGKLGPQFDATTVLERYLHGEEIADIAASLGVHPKALNYHLLKDGIRERWRNAQAAVSQAEYQESKEVVRTATDALSLARAREIMRSCQWDLERLEARLYAPKQEVTGKDGGPLQVQIVRFGQTIEGQSTVVDDAQCSAPTPVLPPIAKP